MNVKHMSQAQMNHYILNQLEQSERNEIEAHLYTCDVCLEQYMNGLEQLQQQLPNLPSNHGFAEKIIQQLSLPTQSIEQLSLETKKEPPSLVPSAPKPKRRNHLQPFVHYTIAASITLLLMSSGVFQEITGFASTIEVTSVKQEENSVTNHLMDKALSFIRKINFNQGG